MNASNHLNWKIIFQLSFFGLIMAFATISLIPQNIEWIFWLVIFVFCAYVIAKVCPGKYFLHGFFVSMENCVWITAVHLIFREKYEAAHPQMAAMNAQMPYFITHPRQEMLVFGPIAGILSGVILGLLSLIASKIVKK